MSTYIPPKDLQLDDYEKEILDAYDKGEIVSRPPTPEERFELEEAARNTMKRLRKNGNINIRVNQGEIAQFKAKAQSVGIPYQTLIGAFIYQYNRDKIKLEL